MDKSEVNDSKKYLSYLKRETGLFINEDDILEKLSELNKMKKESEEFDNQFRYIYRDVMKKIAPQIIKSVLSKYFDKEGLEKQTDLENFAFYIRKIDKAMMGMLIYSCHLEEKESQELVQYVLGGMSSHELMDSLGYEDIPSVNRKLLYEKYLSEKDKLEDMKFHREMLENASMNAYAYIRKEVKMKNLSPEEKADLARRLIPSLSPIYQRVKENQKLIRIFSHTSRMEGKDNLKSLVLAEDNLKKLTGYSTKQVKRELMKKRSNDIPETMERIRKNFEKEDYVSQFKISFLKEFDKYLSMSDSEINPEYRKN